MIRPLVKKKSVDPSIPWFSVVKKTIETPGEKPVKKEFYSIKPPDYVSVVARTKDNNIVFVKQYRPVVEDYTIEIPGGHVEIGQSPEEAASTELEEETGYIGGDFTFLGKLIPDTGKLENILWCFFADGVVKKGRKKETDIETILYPEGRLSAMIKDGTLDHALNIAAIALAVSKGKLKY